MLLLLIKECFLDRFSKRRCCLTCYLRVSCATAGKSAALNWLKNSSVDIISIRKLGTYYPKLVNTLYINKLLVATN